MASSARHFAEQPPVPDGKGRKRFMARVFYAVLAAGCFVIAGSVLLSNYERREAAGPLFSGKPVAHEGLGLAVDRSGTEWKVQWNPSASPLASASQAELLINDGDRSTRILLQPERIRTGNLLYSAYTGDVALKLTAFGDGRESASESLRVLSPEVRADEAQHLASSQTPAKVTEAEADRMANHAKHRSVVRNSKHNRHHRRARRSHRASLENEDMDAPFAADVSDQPQTTAHRPSLRQQVSLLGRKAAHILPFRRKTAELRDESPDVR